MVGEVKDGASGLAIWRGAGMFVGAPRDGQGQDVPAARLHHGGPMTYHLLQADGTVRESSEPGTLGGNSTLQIYGRLGCARAIAALPLGYAKHRVFFADEDAAIQAGYRPCGRCMHEQYAIWKAGPLTSAKYPWRNAPHHPMSESTSFA
jgi:hypothetical protein